jgi:protein-disulfide isomerase
MSFQGQEEDEAELTRKQRREQARAQRKAVEEQQAASAKRRTRLTQLGIVVAVVVVAVVVILIATGGGSSKSGLPSSKHEENATVAEISKLIGGIPQSGNAIGSPKAPVTLKYFGDLQCPICKDFTLNSLPSIYQQWVRPGKLRIEYLSLETATREPEVFNTQQIAAYAAGKQNKAWNFIETFYHEQGEENTEYVNEQYLQGIARQVPGLNLAKWMSDRNDPELTNQVEADKQLANNEGLNGTPAFLIGHTGGTLKRLEYVSPNNPAFIDQAVEQLLQS